MAEMLPEDADAGNLATEGRVMEMLSGTSSEPRLMLVLIDFLQSTRSKAGWKGTFFLVSSAGVADTNSG